MEIALKMAASDPDQEAQTLALELLGKVAGKDEPRAVQVAMDLIASRTSPRRVVVAAGQALERVVVRGNPAVYEQLVALCDRAPPHGAQDSRRATWMLVSLRALRKVAFCGDKTVEDMMLSALSSPNEAVVVAALKGLLALARAPSRPAPPSEGVQNDSMADEVAVGQEARGDGTQDLWNLHVVVSQGEGNGQSGPSTHADARRHMARGRILPTVGPAREEAGGRCANVRVLEALRPLLCRRAGTGGTHQQSCVVQMAAVDLAVCTSFSARAGYCSRACGGAVVSVAAAPPHLAKSLH